MPPPKAKPKISSYILILGPILVAVGTLQYRYNQKQMAETSRYLPIRTIACWNCEGKGSVINPLDTRLRTPCEVCFSIGVRTIRLDPASQVVCTGCSGMGFVHDEELDLTVACSVCRGFGAMKKPRSDGIHETIFLGQEVSDPEQRMQLLPSTNTNELLPGLLLPPKPRIHALPNPEPARP